MKRNLQAFSGNILKSLALITVCLLTQTANAQFGASPWTAPSGTFTVPAGVTSIDVQCQGGGGGGGGVSVTDCSWKNAGGGGGGSYSAVTSIAVTPGQTITIVSGTGGSAGSSSGSTGGTGGTSSVTYNSVIVCSAVGGSGGGGVTTNGGTGAGGSGGGTGVGFMWAGGNGKNGCAPYCGSGGGGGGAGSSGNGNNGAVPAGGTGGFGNPPGGVGGAGTNLNQTDGYAAGKAGAAPGGGGGGGTDLAYNGCSPRGGAAGGAGGAGRVIITYTAVTVAPLCASSCNGWLLQNCTACTTGCYIDGGVVTPTSTLQSASTPTTTTNFGLVYWSFTGTAGVTYYFDLCSSTGESTSVLRLHRARNTSPTNNYCMNANSNATYIVQNIANGCTGTGTGLSKLIWTCDTSGTFYLESAVSSPLTYWGISSAQTATLSYKTLPSSSQVCSAVFYDKGRDGTDGSSMSYNNNENWTYTYYPVNTTTDAIFVQFVSFSSASGDVLTIYDGNSINAPTIQSYAGPSISIAPFMSTAPDGSITFQFTSSDNTISAGWEANITCVQNVGVRNNTLANEIRIYPNPAKDKLEISGLNSSFDNTKVQIFDVVGKSVYADKLNLQTTGNSSQSKSVVDISNLQSGVYFIQITTESGIWKERFVKQ